jgi:hypothetical protein
MEFSRERASLLSDSINGEAMYVIVLHERVMAFGPTPEKANADFLRRYECCYEEGPLSTTHPCSRALYRKLEKKARDGFPDIQCEIDASGVAVPVKTTRISRQSSS